MKVLLILCLVFASITIQAQDVSLQQHSSGYNLIVEAGVGIGIKEYGNNSIEINILNGYNFESAVSLNVGVGARYDFNRGFTFPVFFNMRTFFSKNKIAPFANVDFGRAIRLNDMKKKLRLSV